MNYRFLCRLTRRPSRRKIRRRASLYLPRVWARVIIARVGMCALSLAKPHPCNYSRVCVFFRSVRCDLLINARSARSFLLSRLQIGGDGGRGRERGKETRTRKHASIMFSQNLPAEHHASNHAYFAALLLAAGQRPSKKERREECSGGRSGRDSLINVAGYSSRNYRGALVIAIKQRRRRNNPKQRGRIRVECTVSPVRIRGYLRLNYVTSVNQM